MSPTKQGNSLYDLGSTIRWKRTSELLDNDAEEWHIPDWTVFTFSCWNPQKGSSELAGLSLPRSRLPFHVKSLEWYHEAQRTYSTFISINGCQDS